MPIYLPPISRRQFLTRSLAAGAGLMLGPRLFSATPEVDGHCWALLSDPHIAADRTKVAHDINMTDQFASVVKEVIERTRRPVGAIVNGDLAFNTGETADYASFAELILPLRTAQIPLHLALGNHDHRERFWDALRADKSVARPVVDRQVGVLQTPRANWFVLDSLDKTMSTPGVLGEGQLAWLATALDAHAEKPALVMIHHNPDIGPIKGSLEDRAALFDIIRPRKQVKAFFFGHTHRWIVEQEASGIHLINLPTTAYVFEKGRLTGWVLANLEPQGMRLELRCLDRAEKEHGRVLDLAWRT